MSDLDQPPEVSTVHEMLRRTLSTSSPTPELVRVSDSDPVIVILPTPVMSPLTLPLPSKDWPQRERAVASFVAVVAFPSRAPTNRVVDTPSLVISLPLTTSDPLTSESSTSPVLESLYFSRKGVERSPSLNPSRLQTTPVL